MDKGGEGHDGAQDGVAAEEDEFSIRLKAVVHLVAQGGVVPAITIACRATDVRFLHTVPVPTYQAPIGYFLPM